MYLYEWMITIFSRSIPLDIASRIWDNFLFYGQVFIFRTALGIVKFYEEQFLSESFGFEECLTMLNRPKDIDEDKLFESIESVSIKDKEFEDLMNKYSLQYFLLVQRSAYFGQEILAIKIGKAIIKI